MATGISLHLGLNTLDPDHYVGFQPLHGAERDATAMAQLASARGFATTLLLAAQATFAGVRAAIAAAAAQLRAGDTFLFTFAGHGSTVPDTNGDEPTGTDQTLCLHDRQLVDDLLHEDLGAFAAGVRIVMVSDSCHSGTVARAAFYESLRATPTMRVIVGDGATRALSPDVANAVYLEHQAAYDAQQTAANRDAADRMQASVLLLAACQDLQEARDGAFHGKFTSALLGVWNGGNYLKAPQASYRDLLDRTGAAMADPSQVPNLFQTGAADPALPGRLPFTP